MLGEKKRMSANRSTTSNDYSPKRYLSVSQLDCDRSPKSQKKKPRDEKFKSMLHIDVKRNHTPKLDGKYNQLSKDFDALDNFKPPRSPSMIQKDFSDSEEGRLEEE